jgi:hypothetical protein
MVGVGICWHDAFAYGMMFAWAVVACGGLDRLSTVVKFAPIKITRPS